MLQLKNIVKTYVTGDLRQDALKGVSISFRENEFVSILGQSGSGKTTMLNIIGGLDRYTSGDLVINGVSTKTYKDADWDYYRNNSIGFVFQSYNLIPHQSVLANVELALTLAGVSKKERRQRAVEALKRVGLGDHMHKKPNQMSGGQMQRVAIARALINNPDILLADEPTGALDSETSVQIMELLKEIAKDKLVIMVTHNPELAEQYSTRIVRLRDGQITSDTNPFAPGAEAPASQKRSKISMSFLTALSLSFQNLRTKKGRTLLTAFAGSIGIIGIALILSISSGIQDYIDGIQRDTLSSYPISITQEDDSVITNVLSARGGAGSRGPETPDHENDAIYSSDQLYTLFNTAFASESRTNDLTAFKQWLEQEMSPETAETDLSSYVSTLQYQYSVDLNTYVRSGEGWRSTDVAEALAVDTASEDQENTMSSLISSRLGAMDVWSEMLPGKEGELISDLVYDQYDLICGQWPTNANEIVLVADENNQVSDLVFYALGLLTEEDVNELFGAAVQGEEIVSEQQRMDYGDILGTSFKLVLNCDYYTKNSAGIWTDVREDEAALNLAIENGYDLTIVGILRPNPDATSTSISGSLAYTTALTEYVIDQSAESEIVREQLLPENENYDVLTGLPFVLTEDLDPTDSEKAEKITEYFSTLTPAQKTEVYTAILSQPSEEYLERTVDAYMQQFTTRDSMVELVASTYNFEKSAAEAYLADYSDEELRDLLRAKIEEMVTEKYAQQAEIQVAQMMGSDPSDLLGTQGYAVVAAAFDQMLAETTDEAVLAGYYDAFMPATVSGSTLDDTLAMLGSVNYDCPTAINIYAASFEDKERIDDAIAGYNAGVPEEEQIQYTDYIALIMSGVTTMIDAVSYGLIGFVSIALVVSSIMIGIITYISVLERTKEIGILRSVGASKKDVSRVFNAETVIVGFTAGLIGIGVTVLLNIPISIIAEKLTGISGIAALPIPAAGILVLISVVLTMIAGLIPSKMAAKKDPVIALRTE